MIFEGEIGYETISTHIKASKGSNTNYYPSYDADDPIVLVERGNYFDGVSNIMALS